MSIGALIRTPLSSDNRTVSVFSPLIASHSGVPPELSLQYQSALLSPSSRLTTGPCSVRTANDSDVRPVEGYFAYELFPVSILTCTNPARWKAVASLWQAVSAVA